jgi:thymidylate synthase
MKKEFIPYEQALALKELGFDEPCFGWYDSEYQEILNYDHTHNYCGWLNGNHCSAPTFSQSFRWFREKYGLEGVIQQAKDFTWYRWEISQYNEDGKKYVADWYEYKTYEEAELACLNKLIEIVKNK